MSTGSSNSKSQSVTARIPHDVMHDMESVKMEGESNAGFIVVAMQGEIARRRLMESDKNELITSLSNALQALEKIEEISAKAEGNIKAIAGVAQGEIARLQHRTSKV
ncbi:YlcI/YnfO family protein [Serratia liquefaciens]|uniref:YlcI/YnfO family protein n=1 Tax=Serratia liquefaciens TaxID=614 RepID=UPI00370C72D6